MLTWQTTNLSAFGCCVIFSILPTTTLLISLPKNSTVSTLVPVIVILLSLIHICNYLYNFAKNLNLEVIQDEHLNIIIKKPATAGYENCPGVILQGHMDMVCEKNKDVKHDFEKDPIKLKIVDDMIYADGTTLGADNGIAVAMSLAILASNDVSHPSLEVLITSNEESGMTGATGLDGGLLNGKYIINLDSEEEGYLLVSCAGGNRSYAVSYTHLWFKMNIF